MCPLVFLLAEVLLLLGCFVAAQRIECWLGIAANIVFKWGTGRWGPPKSLGNPNATQRFFQQLADSLVCWDVRNFRLSIEVFIWSLLSLQFVMAASNSFSASLFSHVKLYFCGDCHLCRFLRTGNATFRAGAGPHTSLRGGLAQRNVGLASRPKFDHCFEKHLG